MNETLIYRRPQNPPRILGALAALVAWLLPTTCLARLPEHPESLGLLVGQVTGLELSTSAASILRSAVVLACLTWLCFLFVRAIVRFVFEPSRLSFTQCRQ